MKECGICKGTGNKVVFDKHGNVESIDVSESCENCLGAGEVDADGDPTIAQQVKHTIRQLQKEGVEVENIAFVIEEDDDEEEVKSIIPFWLRAVSVALVYGSVFFLTAALVLLASFVFPSLVSEYTLATFMASGTFGCLAAILLRVISIYFTD